jgi:Uma2 family endonuclease
MAALEAFFSVGAIEMREAAFEYYAGQKKQGEYIIEDVEKIPEKVRVELIDGKLYYLAAPTPINQVIAGEIFVRLKSHIDKKGGDCMAGMAATDFKLDPDSNKTMVQPDVFVICDPQVLGLKRMTGAPDLVVEILSPSNSESKMNEKMLKYRDAGVPEYWAVNYDNKSITVILFEDAEGNAQIHFYTFSDKVPVSIFEDCFIDFAEIDAYVQKYIDKCEGRD